MWNVEQRVQVPGGEIWCAVAGDAVRLPLICVHGGPGLPHEYLSTLVELADERQVVFYDQLGCGKSPSSGAADLWQVERFLDEIDSVRNALGLEDVHVLGHSWGALLALEYAAALPDGLRSAIAASPLVSADRWERDSADLVRRLPTSARDAIEMQELSGESSRAAYDEAVGLYLRRHFCRLDPWPDPLERALAQVGQDVYEFMWGDVEFRATGSLRGWDAEPRLKDIRVPTLWTCGRMDPASPRSTLGYAFQVIGSRFEVFEESSHMPHLEEPDAFLLACRSFLDEVERQ